MQTLPSSLAEPIFARHLGEPEPGTLQPLSGWPPPLPEPVRLLDPVDLEAILAALSRHALGAATKDDIELIPKRATGSQ